MSKLISLKNFILDKFAAAPDAAPGPVQLKKKKALVDDESQLSLEDKQLDENAASAPPADEALILAAAPGAGPAAAEEDDDDGAIWWLAGTGAVLGGAIYAGYHGHGDGGDGPAPNVNNSPSIDGQADGTGSVTELAENLEADGAELSDTGAVPFSDPDAGDSHTVDVTPAAGGYVGALEAVVDQDTTTVNWTFTVLDADVDFLGEGESIQQTYTLTIDDGQGGTVDQQVVITINGANDAAIVDGQNSGDDDGVVTEAGAAGAGDPDDTGDLNHTDVDNDNADDVWQAVAAPTASASGYGSYTFTAAGVWTYNLDNADTAVQALNDGDTLSDSFDVLTEDGTVKTVNIVINGANDAAVVDGDGSGDDAGEVTEAGSVVVGDPTDTGDLNHVDIDNDDDVWQAVAAPTASANGYGTFTVTAAGVWTYTLDDADPTVNALNDGDTLSDSFDVLTEDGTVKTVTIVINGSDDVNTPAVVTGDDDGVVTEAGAAGAGDPDDTGDLNHTDADLNNADDVWQAVAVAADSDNGYGTYTATAAGVWTYNLDNADSAVQALNDGDTLSDTFDVLTEDGTSATVTIVINGANDAAIVDGDNSGDDDGVVTEAGSAGAGDPTDTGDLNYTDVDNTADAWQAVAAPTASANGYGTFTLTAAGVWTYTLDNTDPDVQALNDGDTLSDSFDVLTEDGTVKTVNIVINGANDAAGVTGDDDGVVTEAGSAGAGDPSDTGDLNSTDVDNAADAWQAVVAPANSDNGYGTYTATAAGVWTYNLDNADSAVQALNDGDTLSDTFDVLTEDGTSATVTIVINGANDAAVFADDDEDEGAVTEAGAAGAGVPTDTGDLGYTDVDDVDDVWQAVDVATDSDGGYGTYTMTAAGVWTYTLDNTDPAVNALNVGDTLSDSFDVLTSDGTIKTVVVTINGANDLAIITGDSEGAVRSDSTGNPGTPTDTGDLLATDVDDPNDTFQVVAPGAASISGYGTFAVTAAGVWTYTLDNTDPAVDALSIADTLSDSFVVTSVDGVTQIVNITIRGSEENFDDIDFDIPNGLGVNDGTAGNDRISQNGNVTVPLNGLGGNDQIDGNQGNDSIRGGDGNDSIIGGIGDDSVFGDAGNDVLYGADGNDSIQGNADNDLVYAGSGNDSVDGGAGDDTIVGGSGNDSLAGGDGVDRFFGGVGTDTINGGAGNDIINGGGGSDVLTGAGGADIFRYLTADEGPDTITDFSIADGDTLDFTSVSGYTGAASVTSMQAGGNTVVTVELGATDLTLTLTGVLLTQQQVQDSLI